MNLQTHRFNQKIISVIIIFILVFGIGSSAAILAQNGSDNWENKDFIDTLRRAEAKTAAQQWADAAALWEIVVHQNPVQGKYWFELATAYRSMKDYPKSNAAFEKQLSLGYGNPGTAAYSIARNYSLLGEKEIALDWLEKALAMRFTDLPRAQKEADFAGLRDDRRYRDLVGLIDTGKMSREQGWRTDLQLLSREIKRKGYSLFPRTGTEADFDLAVKNLIDSIPKLTDAQMIAELEKLMRRVGDGHSGLMGGDRAEFLPNLPVQFYLFEEGLFIIAADPKYKDLIGAQVLKFGDRSPDEIIKGLEPTINRDNDIWIRQVAPYRMRSLILLNSLGLIPDPEKVSLTLRGMDGKEREVSLVPDNTQPNIWNIKPNPPTWINLSQNLPAPAPLYMKNPAATYWFEYLPDSKIVYFGFNSVQNDPKEPLAEFATRLFKFIDDHDVEKLAIDLRWNNGGNTMILNPLFEGLIKSEKVNRPGKLFVIIGRRTFSAAQNTATFFERYTNATFIGEPTGSSPNFVGEEWALTLPYSKLLVNVSDLYWESSYPLDKRVWIAPQIYIPPTFKAYRANRDPVLEAIINYHN